MSRIAQSFKNRQRIKWIVFGFGLSAIIGTIVGVYFGTHGNAKILERKRIYQVYKNLFVNKVRADNSNGFLSVSALAIYNKVLNAWNRAPGDFPHYHETQSISKMTRNKETIYQVEDPVFKAGQNEFTNWGSRVIFIMVNNKIDDIQYKRKQT